MKKSRITVVVFPEGLDQVKRWSMPRAFPWAVLAFCFLLFSILISYSAYSYHELQQFRSQRKELKRLRQKTVMQEFQIYSFADKVSVLEQEVAKLHQMDRNLQFVSAQTTINPQNDVPGRGGSESVAATPEDRLKTDVQTLVRRLHRDIDRLLGEASDLEQAQHELGAYYEDARSIMASTPTVLPAPGRLTSFFGYRKNPFGGSRGEFHQGLDIDGEIGDPICSPADGVVISVERHNGYGLILSINHGYGLVTRYAHLSNSYVKEGQRVRRGERVAAIGVSGRTTGPHLHYETIMNGIPVNPLRFVAKQ